MDKPKLTKKEKEIIKEISFFLDKAKKHNYSYKDIVKDIDKFGDEAHKLHLALAKKGCAPQHFKYMIENRGMKASAKDFYKHIHPMEDLLRFINNPDSISDPKDITLNKKFNFEVYSKRWGHNDKYSITRIDIGWNINHISINGDSDKSGNPILFKNLEHDSISYPSTLGYVFEQLWELGKNGISKVEMQNKISEISNWVIQTEKSRPDFDV